MRHLRTVPVFAVALTLVVGSLHAQQAPGTMEEHPRPPVGDHPRPPADESQPRPPSEDTERRDLRAEREAAEREAAERAAAEEVASVNPSRPTTTDNALFVAPRALEFEAGYRVDRDVVDLDGTNTAVFVLQRFDALAKIGLAEAMELRFGMELLGLLSVDGTGEQSAVGDPFAQLKLGVPVDPDNMHNLAVLLTVTPGIGQELLSNNGLGLGAAAVYTVFPGPVQVDAQAGLDMVLLVDTPLFALPLSGVVTWAFLDQAAVFGELAQRLNLNQLNNSGTSLLAGGVYTPLPTLAFDGAFGVGLSPSEPGFSFMLGATWLAAFLP